MRDLIVLGDAPPVDRRNLALSRRALLGGLGASLFAPHAALGIVGKGQRAALITSQTQPVILAICGQSNMIYGVPYTATTDRGSTEFYQMYSGSEGAANHISTGGANDPLDNPDTAGQTTPAIGPAVHFMRDYYVPTYHPSRVLFLPCAFGGTPMIGTGTTQWGVSAAANPVSVGTLTANALTRIKLASQLWPNSKLILIIEDVEQDFDAYGSFAVGQVIQFRAAWMTWMLYMRQQMALAGFVNFPIIIGRPPPTSMTHNIAGVGANSWVPANMVVGDTILRATATRFPYVGIADSVNPTAATQQSGTQEVHYDEAGQVTMAGRYWIGYQQAISNQNFPTAPVWEQLDYANTALGYANGFTVGTGGSTISGFSSISLTAVSTTPSLPSSSARLYAEIKITAASSPNILIGLVNQSYDHQQYVGQAYTDTIRQDFASAGVWTGGSSLLGKGSLAAWTQTAIASQTMAAGDVFMLAIDRGAGTAWVGKNGAWLGSGNPATASNPWLTGIPQTDLIFLAASATGATLAIQGTASRFSFSIPTGFLAWGH